LHLLLHLLDELLLLVALLVLQSEGLVLPMELHMFRSVDHIELLAAGFPHHEVWEAGRWTAGADPAAFPDSQPTSITFSFFFCSVFLLGPGGAFFGGILFFLLVALQHITGWQGMPVDALAAIGALPEPAVLGLLYCL